MNRIARQVDRLASNVNAENMTHVPIYDGRTRGNCRKAHQSRVSGDQNIETERQNHKAAPQEADSENKPNPIRLALDTLPGVIKEICAVYRLMRRDELDHGKGRSLVWVLSMLRSPLRHRPWSASNSVSKNSHPQSKANPMVTRQQVAHLGRRIEAIAAKHGTHTAWVWRYTSETEAEALERHYGVVPRIGRPP